MRKRELGRDADVQVLEDALCLVFIETQFGELAAKLERPKMVDVVRKTLKKMSAEGQAMALSLDMPAGRPRPDRGGHPWMSCPPTTSRP